MGIASRKRTAATPCCSTPWSILRPSRGADRWLPSWAGACPGAGCAGGRWSGSGASRRGCFEEDGEIFAGDLPRRSVCDLLGGVGALGWARWKVDLTAVETIRVGSLGGGHSGHRMALGRRIDSGSDLESEDRISRAALRHDNRLSYRIQAPWTSYFRVSHQDAPNAEFGVRNFRMT